MQHIEIFDIDQNEAKNQVESSFYHGRLKNQIETNFNFLFATIFILCKANDLIETLQWKNVHNCPEKG